jgi:hypothetical protein
VAPGIWGIWANNGAGGGSYRLCANMPGQVAEACFHRAIALGVDGVVSLNTQKDYAVFDLDSAQLDSITTNSAFCYLHRDASPD